MLSQLGRRILAISRSIEVFRMSTGQELTYFNPMEGSYGRSVYTPSFLKRIDIRLPLITNSHTLFSVVFSDRVIPIK